jgi:glycine/D-amino acid oxidase-like deaminating enzyme/nitrite reductase/ring-hydroxylating ferredoxin subunit
MSEQSFWQGTAGGEDYPMLSGNVEADVIVIGGGITGMVAALLLSREGKRVVVLEALRIGQGTTAFSTGNLYATVDEQLASIRDTWNAETAASVVRSRSAALDLIENTIIEFNIACGFARRPQYIFATGPDQVKAFTRELEVSVEAGLPVSETDDLPLPLAFERAMKIENQAQFHPLAFVQGLASAIQSDTCQIFEHSPVAEIDADKHVVQTPNGTVTARHIFMATHVPKGFNLVQTVLGPYREYGIAVRLASDSYPEGIFWTMEEPSHSIRSYDANGTKYLIVIGEKHKTGQPDSGKDYFQSVEDYARAHFDVTDVAYRWSAQHYRPADKLPYIGLSSGSHNLYIATGFATSGLVYGPLAAMIVCDAILGRENPWSELYKAARFTPVKSAADFLAENANVAREYVRDYFGRSEVEAAAEVQAGEGRLAQVGKEKLAVYRSETGELVALSPVCTHLGCLVHWNDHERTWDCPCHGSRFGPTGEVLEGPAIKGLERKDLRDN